MLLIIYAQLYFKCVLKFYRYMSCGPEGCGFTYTLVVLTSYYFLVRKRKKSHRSRMMLSYTKTFNFVTKCYLSVKATRRFKNARRRIKASKGGKRRRKAAKTIGHARKCALAWRKLLQESTGVQFFQVQSVK